MCVSTQIRIDDRLNYPETVLQLLQRLSLPNDEVVKRADEQSETDFLKIVVLEIFEKLGKSLDFFVNDRDFCILLRGELISRKIKVQKSLKLARLAGDQYQELLIIRDCLNLVLEVVNHILMDKYQILEQNLAGITTTNKYAQQMKIHLVHELSQKPFFKSLY